MSSKEMLAIKYTFFRFPSHYALTLIPVISGIVSVLFFHQFDEVSSNNRWELVALNQFNLLERYLSYSKISLVFIASFFIGFKWSNMQINGSYGFWLTQRVHRHSFFIRAISTFIIEIYLSITIGIVLLLYPIGIRFTTIELLLLMYLMFIQIIILIASSILIAETIPNAEIAALIFLILGTLNFLLNNNESTIFHKILKSDLHFQDNSVVIPLLLSTITAALLLFSSFFVHLRRSIDL